MTGAFNCKEKIGRILSKVEGYLSEEEGKFLHETARKCALGKGEIVEIGSWKGKSTICLGLGSKAGSQVMIYAIDPHKNTQAHRTLGSDYTYEEFRNNIKAAGVEDVISALLTTSQEAAGVFDKPVQFLFIDGEHDYSAVKLDFELWFPKLIDGGIIAFHDCTLPGPKKVIEEYIYKSKYFRNTGCVFSIFFAQKVRQNSLGERAKNRILLFLDRAAYLYQGLPFPKPALKFRERFSRIFNYSNRK